MAQNYWSIDYGTGNDEYCPESQVAIRHSHSMIHNDKAFVVTSVVSIAPAATFLCCFKAPASDDRMHAVLNCGTSTNGVTVSLYEDADVSGGTPITPTQRNRNSANAATMQAFHTPNVNSNGTLIYQFHINAGIQGASAEHGTDEIVLKAGSTYMVAITCDSGGQNATFSGRMDWYELTKALGD